GARRKIRGASGARALRARGRWCQDSAIGVLPMPSSDRHSWNDKGRVRDRLGRGLPPALAIAAFLLLWSLAIRLAPSTILPGALPQLLVGLRLALGIAWLVVVTAEMIPVTSGLGFLIVAARNAGNRYDLVVAGMVSIGLVGLALDTLIGRLERLPPLRRATA